MLIRRGIMGESLCTFDLTALEVFKIIEKWWKQIKNFYYNFGW